MSKKRLEYIDYARGFCIILMIMGHIGFGDAFYKFIHAFHMPIFFVMSGYLYRDKENIGSEIVRKIKQLIVPYFIIGIGHYLIWLVLNHDSDDLTEPLINLLWVNTNLNMPIAGALWFLTCLFWVDVIFMVTKKFLKNASGIIFIALAILGSVFTQITDIRLPWALDAAMVGIGFYYAGYLLKKYSSKPAVGKLMELSLPVTAVSAVVICVLIFVNGTVNMREGSYAVIPLSWINGIGSSIILLNLCKITEKHKDRFLPVKTICSKLRSVGANSIVYLCFNQLCILVCNKAKVMIFGTGTMSLPLLEAVRLVILIVTVAALALTAALLTKSKFKFIIGR